MKVGDRIRGIVRDINSSGQGVIATDTGHIVFVFGVWVNEDISVKVTQKRGRIYVATLLEIHTTSDYRVSARCAYHGNNKDNCGACPWQSIAYSEQLRVKQKRVNEAVKRLDNSIVVEAIKASPNIYTYRNRAQLKTNGQKLGYVAANSHTLVDVKACPILTEANQQTLTLLQENLPNTSWKPKRKNTWVTLDIDESIDAFNVSVDQRLPFKQANTEQNQFMKHWLHQKLTKFSESDDAIELFCGSGNFTEVIANNHFSCIYAYEGDEQAIYELQQKNLSHVEASSRNLFISENIERIFKQHKNANVLILDPPRDGMKCKEGMFRKKSKLTDIFYISCDLATFIRDVGYFYEHGFRIKELQPLDQFPHTPHIELLCHLQKVDHK